ncbi:fused MFS/spermidine synthase [Bosea sp. (in: a-proteobacteria)]|jgi:predicted membrane-bound spermidine synthase|uniref:fused MFS/spermidine synthase n=1 Tax=Bosea sp. (in: a-proteobacteria) TaxID=1871050 RepID=UPI001AC4E473|nr:fused MFS/spermidine synthase [Bosea sp. (in: a-proteobacteria)]MBN9438023.1 fused MFS/spermidine synthase [Bosea sp. (in: a-proteobacteria)]
MIHALLLAEALIASCALAFETAAARLVAPYAGMSTDSWTAIIAGFLLSWALGNHVGGRCSAGGAQRSLCRAAAAVAGAAAMVAATPLLLPALDSWLVASDPVARWRLALFAALPTLGPGFLFGIAPPLVMLAIIRHSGGHGALVGIANAAGAAGSAAGAVAVLWLGLDWLGTRGTCLAIAALGLVTAALLMATAFRADTRHPA